MQNTTPAPSHNCASLALSESYRRATIWPQPYRPDQEATPPAEELLLLRKSGDYGWPECHSDNFLKTLAPVPEYRRKPALWVARRRSAWPGALRRAGSAPTPVPSARSADPAPLRSAKTAPPFTQKLTDLLSLLRRNVLPQSHGKIHRRFLKRQLCRADLLELAIDRIAVRVLRDQKALEVNSLNRQIGVVSYLLLTKTGDVLFELAGLLITDAHLLADLRITQNALDSCPSCIEANYSASGPKA